MSQGLTALRHNQKFDIALWPGDRAFDNAIYRKAQTFDPALHFAANALMQRNIANNPAFSNLSASHFELRLDKRMAR
jgi:hypothetical protein